MNPEMKTTDPIQPPTSSTRPWLLRGPYSLANAFLGKALGPLIPVQRRNEKAIVWQRSSLIAVGMGLVAAAFLLTRPRTLAPHPKAGCGSCGASAGASNTCEMRAAPSNTSDATTHVKHSGVPHE